MPSRSVSLLLNDDVWDRILREARKRETSAGVIIAAAMDCYDETAEWPHGE